MKKHRQRGVLLCVTMALLMSGGVPVAQGMSVTADKDCIECWPGKPTPIDDHFLIVTFAGWNHSHDAYAEWLVNGAAEDSCVPGD